MTDRPTRYPVPARIHRVEETIRKSRFITTGARAPEARAAHDFVARIRDEFPDATHNCWAFVAGAPGSTTSVGMSDDGEPHGTAGRPMLTALLHGGVGEIVAVSTRYFGGTKLGTGGLSRAYAGGVKLLLGSLPTEEKVERVPLLVEVAYETVDPLKRLLDEVEATVDEEEYGAVVRFRVGVPEGNVATFEKTLAGLTRGRASVESVTDGTEPG
jgi:uncharacterized YigZ family protein